jgi:phosphoglycerate kinase
MILLTHVGRPRNKKTGELTLNEKTSVKPIVEYLLPKLHIKLKVRIFREKKKDTPD